MHLQKNFCYAKLEQGHNNVTSNENMTNNLIIQCFPCKVKFGNISTLMQHVNGKWCIPIIYAIFFTIDKSIVAYR